MKTRHYILLILLCSANLLFAQAVKFTATASKTTVGTGEQFQVDFSVNANAGDFITPAFGSFEVLSGPNTATSMESINGNTTVSTSYSYILMGTKVGDYVIGPGNIVVNGKKYTSNVLKIKVVKGRPVPQNTQAQPGAAGSGVTEATGKDLSKSVFIRAVVNKSTPYLGQQILLDFKLYTRVDIEQGATESVPDLNGFWSEDIKDPNQQQQQQTQWHTENYRGVAYRVADLRKTILLPERVGDITIDPMVENLLIQVRQPSNDIMDQFFGGNYQELKYKTKSPPVVIHVKPLPDAGKPDGFTGAVGKFSIDASVDKTELKANEALNYKVKVTGSGNIKLLKTLNVSFPADFEKYDPKITDTIVDNENGASGSRIYTYLLIPRHQGDYTIDPLKFSYFNPASGKYVTLDTKGFHIKVDKGTATSNVTALADADKQPIQTLGKDIRYIKTGDGALRRDGDDFFGSFGYFVLLLIGPVFCYGAFVYRNRMRELNSDIVKVKSRRAGKVAAKRMASAQQQLQANNQAAFYESVFRGLYGYLSDKLNIQYANLDRETIGSALKARSVDDGIITRLHATLDLCEMARYAPVTHISQQEVFDKAKGIINDIENEI